MSSTFFWTIVTRHLMLCARRFGTAGGPIFKDRNVQQRNGDSTLEDGSTMLFRNAGHQSPSDAAQQPRRTENLTAPLRKPKNSKGSYISTHTLFPESRHGHHDDAAGPGLHSTVQFGDLAIQQARLLLRLLLQRSQHRGLSMD